MNRGAKRLAACFENRGAQAALAEVTGLDQGYLSRLASGERTPGAKARRTLEGACGILMQWWDEPPEPDHEDSAQ